MAFAKSRLLSKTSPTIYKRHHFSKKTKILGYYFPSKLGVLYDDEILQYCSGEVVIFTKEKPSGIRVVIPYGLLKKIPLPGNAGVHECYAVYVDGHVAEMEKRYGTFSPTTSDVVVARRFKAISIKGPQRSIVQINQQPPKTTKNDKASDKDGNDGEEDKEQKLKRKVN